MASHEDTQAGGRMISVQLQLESGHELKLTLGEQSPELVTLFRILASRNSDTVTPAEQFLQLPLNNGAAACSFHSRQLVSIITEPPVVVQLEQAETPETAPVATAVPPTVVVNTPRYLIIDDFLGHDEHRDMLAFAMNHEDQFEAGTVVGHETPHRKNQVILSFAETAHAKLLSNRLLTWLPMLTEELQMELFPVRFVESQLTASNDGHYYRVHCDTGADEADFRAITCVYYFFREPRPFNGGTLRLYDSINQGDRREASGSYREIEAVSNRLVVFPSSAHHELMRIRCPSGKFGDSRFAITNWIQISPEPRPDDTFGWGHLRCGVLPAQYGDLAGSSQ